MFSVTIKKKEMDQMLLQMRKQRRNARSLMTAFYGKVHQEVMLNFRLQSAPPDIFSTKPGNTRKNWKPVSSYTAASRLGSRLSTSSVGAALQESGELRGSMGKIRVITASSMVYGTPSGISATQHFGATIKPKRAKYLALPYPGVKGRPREYQNTFFRTSAAGKTTLYQADGEGGLKPLFFLRDEVTIPARPHMTISAKTMDNMEAMTWQFLIKKVSKV